MKRCLSRSKLKYLSLLSALTIGICIKCDFAVLAAPGNAGSERMDTRSTKLNNSQPAWVQHYLPDDRKKVTGGVWKFVYSDEDEFFHRPDCPVVLQQSAENTFGFASIEDAKEAGYEADPVCVFESAVMQNRATALQGYSQQSAVLEQQNPSSTDAMRRYNAQWNEYLVRFEEWKTANTLASSRYKALDIAIIEKRARGVRITDAERQARNQAKIRMERIWAAMPRQPVMPKEYADHLDRNYSARSVMQSYRSAGRR